MDPKDSSSLAVLQNNSLILRLGLAAWGPRWGWVGSDSHDQGDGVTPLVIHIPLRMKPTPVGMALAWAAKDATLTGSVDFTTTAAAPLTMIALTLDPKGELKGCAVDAIDATGAKHPIPVPFPRGDILAEAAGITFHGPHGDIVLHCDPPCHLSADGALRWQLAAGSLPEGTTHRTVTLTTPGPLTLEDTKEAIAKHTATLAGPDWFQLKSTNDLGPSRIGCEDWLDAPAGHRGPVQIQGDHFATGDRSHLPMWGVNLSYGLSAPSHEDADFTAARFAKFGVTAVRMHKFANAPWEGIGDPHDCTLCSADGLERLDYFCHQLATHGVYFGWSPTYGMQLQDKNFPHLLAPQEIRRAFGKGTGGLINFCPDIQDLNIQRIVNLLTHVNPYSKLPYAKDPALSYVEIQNEDDILWWSSGKVYDTCPTYRQLIRKGFAAWVKAHYPTQEALKAAWQEDTKNATITAEGLDVLVNPWFYTSDHLPKVGPGERQHLLDQAHYLHELQDRYYAKAVAAIRATGYAGCIVGSPWQAPTQLPHYLNLASDAAAGYIDRHNYFDGFQNSMLRHPGSGLLSTGLQQDLDLPFGLSEWTNVYPCVYAAEAPVLIAAYGFGLNGWDASYEFQSAHNDRHTFSKIVGAGPWGVWNADLPSQMGQYPLLARMLLRGDLQEGSLVGVRTVSTANLASGTFPFSDAATQEGDIKTFGGSIPPEALALGRVGVRFTGDKTVAPTFPTLPPEGQPLLASTGQLAWYRDHDGYVTIDSPGTIGLCGFVGGVTATLKGGTLTCATPYASILVTAREPGATLATAKTALLSAVARESNTGFRYSLIDHAILDNGKDPILLEPVHLTVRLARPVATCTVLDQDGRTTAHTLAPAADGTITIDEAADRTWYYELTFK